MFLIVNEDEVPGLGGFDAGNPAHFCSRIADYARTDRCGDLPQRPCSSVALHRSHFIAAGHTEERTGGGNTSPRTPLNQSLWPEIDGPMAVVHFAAF